jgi:hypothetical protein
MLLFPIGYHRIKPTVEMGYTGWNLPKSRATSDGILMMPTPLGYPWM